MSNINNGRRDNLNILLLKNINQAIKEAELSKTEIAKKLGITYPTLWKVLHGKLRLKPEHIAEIAHMTCKTPNDFFYVQD